MIANAYYEHAIQGAYEHYDLGDLVLEEGETLRGAKLTYRTYLGTSGCVHRHIDPGHHLRSSLE